MKKIGIFILYLIFVLNIYAQSNEHQIVCKIVESNNLDIYQSSQDTLIFTFKNLYQKVEISKVNNTTVITGCYEDLFMEGYYFGHSIDIIRIRKKGRKIKIRTSIGKFILKD